MFMHQYTNTVSYTPQGKSTNIFNAIVFENHNTLAYFSVMDLRDRLQQELKKREWTPNRLAIESGVPQPTIQRFLKGVHGEPHGNTVRKLAKGLGLTEAELRGNVLSVDSVIPQPSIDAHAEGSIINVTTTIMRNVPLISWVQAGDFCEAIDNFHVNDAEEWMPTEYAVRAHTYALRVVGDSMTPDFPEGTVLIVEPTEDLRHGRYVIAKRGNDVTFKQAVQDGTKWYLKPLNNAYPTVELTEDTTICGIVVETLARRKTI